MVDEAQELTPEVAQQVLSAIRDLPDDGLGPAQFRTSTGIVFNLRKVPPLLIQNAQEALKEPMPPTVFNKDKDAEEVNLSDPGWLAAMREWRRAVNEVANGVMLTRGTSIHTLPEGTPPVESDEWIEEVEDLTDGMVKVPRDSRAKRYYCWMKYVALSDMQDFLGILRKISGLAGQTLEDGVAQAMKSFRSDEARGTNNGVHPSAEG